MKKYLTLILLIGCSFFSFSQDTILQYEKPKHTFELETGAFDRGFLGVGYNYNVYLKDKLFLTTHLSSGIGPAFDGPNVWFTFSEEISIGNRIHFTIGPDLKYAIINYLDGGDYFTTYRYQGLLVGGHLGFGIFTEKKFNFKLRAGHFNSTTKISNTNQYSGITYYSHLWYPSFGLSFGWRLGKAVTK